MSNTNLNLHGCTGIRAHVSPATGALMLFVYRGDERVSIDLYGLPVAERDAIAAAVPACDANGFTDYSTRMEVLPMQRLDALNGDDSDGEAA